MGEGVDEVLVFGYQVLDVGFVVHGSHLVPNTRHPIFHFSKPCPKCDRYHSRRNPQHRQTTAPQFGTAGGGKGLEYIESVFF